MLANSADSQEKGSEVRALLKDLSDFLRPLLDAISEKHPHHVHTSISKIITNKRGGAQKIHSDFDVNLIFSDEIDKLPFSIIVPLNCKRVLNIILPPAQHAVPMTVHPQSYMLFRGDMMHGGGLNDLKQYAYSAHIYFGVERTHLPVDEVFLS